MAYDFMDNIRFRSVIWIFDVSEVLRGAEEFKGKSVEELSLAQNSMCGFDSESSARVKIRREFSQLRDSLLEMQFFIQLLTVFQKPLAHSLPMQMG